jgi:hypothetical protein
MAETVLEQMPEKDYGDTQALEAQRRAAPIPKAERPTKVAQTAAEAAAAAEEQPPSEEEPRREAPRREEKRRHPNMWLIPQRYEDIGMPQTKPITEAMPDIATLWDVLATDPYVDPMVRFLAQRIKGEV